MKQNAKSVLVVDDEVKILEVIKSFLEEKGFTVFTSENAKQAFEIFDRENISLAILDVMLPDMSGDKICLALRQRSRVPIIMLTAKVAENDILNGLENGADDYITKPFSLKELYARMEAVLRRSGNELIPLYKKNSFNGGDLEIDFESHTVRKKRQEVNLTPIEFKILAALIKYPNKIFSREDIISIALGDEYRGYDRAVDCHVKNIRQKIEDDSKNPEYILTVHGVGYKFDGK
ncbi:MAG: response regulator transcription factor [Synergistaceae bacterium]|nr:response regulator transcription factor [Synergistaceae bacterium]